MRVLIPFKLLTQGIPIYQQAKAEYARYNEVSLLPGALRWYRRLYHLFALVTHVVASP